jgi:gliding motility-associated-like protein
MNRLLIGFIFLLHALTGQGQEVHDVWFHPNRGQWEEHVRYKVELQKGAFYVEKDGFTYDFTNLDEVIGHGQEHHHNHDHTNAIVQRHTIFSKFKGSEWKGAVVEEDTSGFYRNYFLGQDTTQWASHVYSYRKLQLKEFYPGIDLVLETQESAIKYSFIVSPGADPTRIEVLHNGADSVYFAGADHLGIATRFGSILENNLVCWTFHQDGQRKQVKSNFELSGNSVRFEFPDGYDTTETLVIDPSITFSSFTGATVDNWGFTAAPDSDANAFGGGIVFGTGYPITSGAYDQTFNGGEGTFNIDIGISKFNATGTALIYSTYVGGNRNETPNSIVANHLDELFVLGVTSSTNFPLAGTPVQGTFAGGTLTTQNALQFTGTDLVIFKLSANGANLLGSTYFGGSGNDGLNLGVLNYNYGDQFRGEIAVDEASNVYIASSTQSSNFPTPNGSNTVYGGNQDAVVAKFSADLNTVFWSTYFGGNGAETGNALQIASNGNVYLTGGTTTANLGLNGHIPSALGGLSDGYIVQLNGMTSATISGTYVGTTQYDQCYFVQLDLDDNVYVFGQSRGTMPISPGKYSNPNSGQFIRKYNSALTMVEWSTVVGGGNGNIEISPTAFLVSDCYEIYYAGWGGVTNQSSSATQSTTNGFPVTSDAFQSNTNGNNFYVAVLGENATSLNYASYMGGITSSSNHVDGGTSRFDKKGRIYHAVCGGCGGNATGFTTTPGVYSPTNPSPNCNMAVFKFDLGIIESAISAPAPFVCIPDPVVFQNNSTNANSFIWSFGDGNTSTEFEPTHFYTSPGTYTVTLVAADTLGCYEADSSVIEVTIGLFAGAVSEPPSPVCPGTPYQLEASGGSIYTWSPAHVLDDSTSATPTAIVFEPTLFTVIISDSCGTDTLTVFLDIYGADADVIDDFSMCRGDTVEIWATGGATYAWLPESAILSDPTAAIVTISPEVTTTYTVDIITPEGCSIDQEVVVSVFDDLPIPLLEDTLKICRGNAVQIIADGAEQYVWTPEDFLDVALGPAVVSQPDIDLWYVVEFINACGSIFDSVFVELIDVFPVAGNDTIVCPGEPVNLWAEGGINYQWSPPETVFNPTAQYTGAQPQFPTIYTVLVTDEFGCSATTEVIIAHYPLPFIQTSPDVYAFQGDIIQLGVNASSNSGTYSWSPTEYLSCVNCPSPLSSTPESMTYTVEFVDENGCSASDQVSIYFEGILYVPNTFTPDGNQFNERFGAVGGNIAEFHLMIFNRWGEMLFESYDMDEHWDGTYQGRVCQDGTYIWKIYYKDIMDNEKEIAGHVILLR